MLNGKKIIFFGLFICLVSYGRIVAQGPTVSVTFKADQSVTEPIVIQLARQSKTLPAFQPLQSNSIIFRTGLRFNTNYLLDAENQTGTIKSQPLTINIPPTTPSIVITVSIDTTKPPAQQIRFQPNNPVLRPRTAGL